ncbi:MAG: hypothetical protein N4A62_17645 [Marinisporobacter sp.]|jgi:hypothetical protein|nr:hypothetical protein [Marinisporobacter sp.]
MDFDDIIKALTIFLPIIGYLLKGIKRITKRDEGKEEEKDNSRENEKISNEVSSDEKLKEMKNLMREEISSTLQKDHSNSKKVIGHEEVIEIENNKTREWKIEEYYPFEESTKKEEKVEKKEIEDMISQNEIGKEGLVFNKKSIVNGIIMSEILKKPKSLRR